MDLGTKKSLPLFFFTFIFTLFSPVLFPQLHIIFFAPFLVTLYYQKSFSSCLWSSFLCGLILDLLSASFFGLHVFNFCIITALLFTQKRHFFADSLSTLPIMVFFFSFLSTFFEAILIHTFDSNLILSIHWIINDLLTLSCLDGAFAFICFILPAYLFGPKRRKGKDYFLTPARGKKSPYF